MLYTCLGYLYDEQSGFPDRDLAEKVVKALGTSMVSIEVKGYAKGAAIAFNLT